MFSVIEPATEPVWLLRGTCGSARNQLSFISDSVALAAPEAGRSIKPPRPEPGGHAGVLPGQAGFPLGGSRHLLACKEMRHLLRDKRAKDQS